MLVTLTMTSSKSVRPVRGQGLQMGALCRDPLAMGGIPAPDDLVHEGTVVRQICKLRPSPASEGVADRRLEMAVPAFDGAVLMSDPRLLRVGAIR